jgi:hypothetical protein
MIDSSHRDTADGGAGAAVCTAPGLRVGFFALPLTISPDAGTRIADPHCQRGAWVVAPLAEPAAAAGGWLHGMGGAGRAPLPLPSCACGVGTTVSAIAESITMVTILPRDCQDFEWRMLTPQ